MKLTILSIEVKIMLMSSEGSLALLKVLNYEIGFQ